jgi:glutamyl-tRNA reductase
MTRPLWVLTAAAPAFDASSREVIGASLAALRAEEPGSILLTTCHRVELYGAGVPPRLARLAGADAPREPDLLVGRDAATHLCRLATGLESAVIGEQQVLHQLRAALRASDAAGRHLDPAVARAWHIALWAGRRARSGQRRDGRNLGDLAIRWLEHELGGLAGRNVLVVGTGVMGHALEEAARTRGAAITLATRRRSAESRPRVLGLREAADRVPQMDAVAVALGGPWVELAAAPSVPVAVDLSFPAAIPAAVRARVSRLADVDTLAGLGLQSAAAAGEDQYQSRAHRIVEDAVERTELWLAARRSSDAIRAIRERAEVDRRRAVDRLLRRLPELDQRERELVTALSEQLVATLLHRPIAALHADADGSAAAAAQRLFGR